VRHRSLRSAIKATCVRLGDPAKWLCILATIADTSAHAASRGTYVHKLPNYMQKAIKGANSFVDQFRVLACASGIPPADVVALSPAFLHDCK
jgi:hypothetical protein